MGGWWGDYSFRCQPVDHSTSGRAMRVSSRFEQQKNYVKYSIALLH